MKRWLKILLSVIGAILLLIAVLVGWAHWEYGSRPPIAHQRLSITLPFSAENEATNLIPMGETIAHPFKGGHPGIDFQWTHSVPLIAVGDGRISSITAADDMGEPVVYLTLAMGSYKADYKELDRTETGLTVGQAVHQGDVLGYPHCVIHVDQNGSKHQGCQLHWEFAYNSFLPTMTGMIDRLCPLTYFDRPALARINQIWTNVPANDQFKSRFPYICSNVYYQHDQ